METQEFFKFLPSEVIMSILSKLPVRTVTICKCVCKSWLHLVETDEFVKLHLPTSLPGLVTFQLDQLSNSFKFFEVEDNGGDVERHDHHYNLASKFCFPHNQWIHGSVDGLLVLKIIKGDVDGIYICNPITRDYIMIQNPPEFPHAFNKWVTWGYGSCKMTDQFKVVRILLDIIYEEDTLYYRAISVAECHVYTLGTGSVWRRLALALHCVPPRDNHPGAFVNGNLHWLGCDLKGCLWISCFDLETESFSNFSAPPLAQRSNLLGAPRIYLFELFALGGSLCLVDTIHGNDVVIWLMEKYGVAESWTKKLVINRDLDECRVFELQPIKIFKDGDILMVINDNMLFFYSNKSETIQQVDMFKGNCPDTYGINAISHTPNFRSLKSFGMENVSSF